MPTPHNAAEVGDIAKVVLMPGDPLRAKYLAEHYLENVKTFTQVRNMFGFTGTYKGMPLSVMGSGMGIPSMSIYAYELYNFYGVDTIIRIGTAGGLAPQVKVRDIVVAQATCTDSNFAAQYGMPGTFVPICDFGLLRNVVDEAERLGVSYHVGNVLSTDVFYRQDNEFEAWTSMGVLAVEMECAGLYLNAAAAGKKAIGVMTVSDLPLKGESLSAQERETSLTQMMEVVLAAALQEQTRQ